MGDGTAGLCRLFPSPVQCTMSCRDNDTGEEYSPYVVCAPDLLQYLPESHSSFYRDDDSLVSELSIPFSDVPVSEVVLSNIPRGQSVSTLLTFSAEHQRVMNTLRKASLTLDSLVAEPLEFVPQKRRLSRVASTSLDDLVRECLNNPTMRLTPPTSSEEDDDDGDEKKKEEVKKEAKELEGKKVAQTMVESEVEYFDTRSGLWKMLGAYDEFVVTKPGFNVFTQPDPHWSEKDPPSWDKLEESRQKCEEWLNKCNPPEKK